MRACPPPPRTHTLLPLQVVRDSMMMKFVPALKRGMEAVIYSYKGILADNHLLDTFWIGNLKNRSLDGKEVRCGTVWGRLRVRLRWSCMPQMHCVLSAGHT